MSNVDPSALGVPEGWAVSRLAEIADVNPRHPRDLDGNLEVTFAPMPALSESHPDFQRTETRTLKDVRKGYTHFAEGDVLFAKITPCMENGKAAIARNLSSGLGCGTTELHVLRPSAAIIPEYLYHFLHQESVRSDAAAHFTGSAGQLRVPVSFVNDLVIPLPPLAEQKRIVAKVESLLAKVQSARARLARVPFLLKRLRQSILAAACDGRLTSEWRESQDGIIAATNVLASRRATSNGRHVRRGVPRDVPVSDVISNWTLPETWSFASTAELLRSGALDDVKDGNHGANHPKVSDFTLDGMPFITAAQVNDYQIDYGGAYKLAGQPLARIRVGIARAEDVVYTHKGSVGRVAVADRDCILTPQTTYYRVEPTIFVARYLMYFLASQFFSEQVDAIKEQTTRDFVPISEQYRLFLRVPPLPEQEEIVHRVDSLFAFARAIEHRVAAATARADKLTQAVLAKAFRGELVPTEADLAAAEGRDYESATALLERVLNSRQTECGTATVRRRRPATVKH